MWEQAAAQVLSRAAATPTGSNSAGTAAIETGNDFSGWTVSTGSSSARGGSRTDSSAGPSTFGAADRGVGASSAALAGFMGGGDMLTWVVAIAGLFALSRLGK